MEGMKNLLHGFALSCLPKYMRDTVSVMELIEKEIYLTEKKIGKEKTAELVNQFKNEAFAQRGVNSVYIIRKLKEARDEMD